MAGMALASSQLYHHVVLMVGLRPSDSTKLWSIGSCIPLGSRRAGLMIRKPRLQPAMVPFSKFLLRLIRQQRARACARIDLEARCHEHSRTLCAPTSSVTTGASMRILGITETCDLGSMY